MDVKTDATVYTSNPVRTDGNSECHQRMSLEVRTVKALFEWQTGVIVGAYEEALKDIEHLKWGGSYARRVRQRAKTLISDGELKFKFPASLLLYATNPSAANRSRCNEVISDFRNHKDMRSIATKEKLAKAVQSMLQGEDQMCLYCCEIHASLQVKAKFCSAKCFKGYYNRRDYKKRQTL